MKNLTKLASFLTIAASVIFSGCATSQPGVRDTSAPVPQERQIKTGMTKAEVENVLGKPASVAQSSDGTEVWAYNENSKMWIPFYAIAGGKFKNITVTFDETGKVKTWSNSNTSLF